MNLRRRLLLTAAAATVAGPVPDFAASADTIAIITQSHDKTRPSRPGPTG